jgi:hypothetical protein
VSLVYHLRANSAAAGNDSESSLQFKSFRGHHVLSRVFARDDTWNCRVTLNRVVSLGNVEDPDVSLDESLMSTDAQRTAAHSSRKPINHVFSFSLPLEQSEDANNLPE